MYRTKPPARVQFTQWRAWAILAAETHWRVHVIAEEVCERTMLSQSVYLLYPNTSALAMGTWIAKECASVRDIHVSKCDDSLLSNHNMNNGCGDSTSSGSNSSSSNTNY